jgi:hypothetical protein
VVPALTKQVRNLRAKKAGGPVHGSGHRSQGKESERESSK